jgi:hypothetical protein
MHANKWICIRYIAQQCIERARAHVDPILNPFCVRSIKFDYSFDEFMTVEEPNATSFM